MEETELNALFCAENNCQLYFSVWEKLVNSACKQTYSCLFTLAGYSSALVSETTARYQFLSKFCTVQRTLCLTGHSHFEFLQHFSRTLGFHHQKSQELLKSAGFVQMRLEVSQGKEHPAPLASILNPRLFHGHLAPAPASEPISKVREQFLFVLLHQ